MSILKKIIRGIALPTLIQLRLDKILLSRAENKFLIVNFHGVRAHTQHTINNRHMPVAEFEKIICYLKANFDILPLSKLFELNRENKSLHRKTIALTFDDGYLNNFDVALPILKKYQVPATFYIITKGLEDPSFLAWPDKVDLAKSFSNQPLTVNGLVFEAPNYRNEQLHIDLINYLKSQGNKTDRFAAEILSNCGELESLIKKNYELVKLADANQIKKFGKEPLIEFGSHSHSHFNMEFLSEQDCIEELQKSKQILSEAVNRPVTSIAFPDGSYTNATTDLSKKAGYTDLLAVDLRKTQDVGRKDLLPRFTISNSTTFESNVLRLAKEYNQFSF